MLRPLVAVLILAAPGSAPGASLVAAQTADLPASDSQGSEIRQAPPDRPNPADSQAPPDRQPASGQPQRFATEVVVTPERGDAPRALVPGATALIDRPTLDALPVIQSSELVSFLPGFNVASSEFYAGRPVVSSRGFFGGGEAEYVLLLVDGVRVADVESGLIDWSIVPTS